MAKAIPPAGDPAASQHFRGGLTQAAREGSIADIARDARDPEAPLASVVVLPAEVRPELAVAGIEQPGRTARTGPKRYVGRAGQ